MAIQRSTIEGLLRQALKNPEIQWHDPRGDGLQPALTVACGDFAGLDRLNQHRLVRRALAPVGDVADSLVLRTTLPNPSFPLS